MRRLTLDEATDQLTTPHTMKERHISAAGTTLAHIPELVENILLQMPLDKILLAQRVSRTWRDTIQQSPDLQRALFFKPVSGALPYAEHSKARYDRTLVRITEIMNVSKSIWDCTSCRDCTTSEG